MKIYLAAMYAWRARVKAYAQELSALGFTVTSSWLRETKPPEIELGDCSNRFLRDHAERDEADIRAADTLVIFTVAPTKGTKRGGRHVEFGIALALGKTLIVCGPRENIFHHLPMVKVRPEFEGVKAWLVAERERRRGAK